jgi:hypothetical protein
MNERRDGLELDGASEAVDLRQVSDEAEGLVAEGRIGEARQRPGETRPEAPNEPPESRVSLKWLDGDDDPHPAADNGPENARPAMPGGDRPVPGPEKRGRGGRAGLMGVLVLLGLIGGGYLFLRPEPEPTSAALDAERAAPAAPIGAAEPLPQVDPDAPEAPALNLRPVEPAAPPTPTAEPLPQPEPEPSSSSVRPEPRPPAALDPAAGEQLVQIARQLETHQALIERLERAEQMLRDRLEGLEIHAQATAESADPAPVAEAPGVRPPKAQPVRPVRKNPRVPPSTTSLPVKTLRRRAPSPGSPLPFSVESVDTWNGEKTVVVRSQGRLIDLKPGESHHGWRIESAQGQTVTVRTPDGGEHTIEAGEGSKP